MSLKDNKRWQGARTRLANIQRSYSSSLGATAASYEDAAPSVESFVAALEEHGVTGEPIDLAVQAAEAQATAADLWTRCHAALAEQDHVREAYESTPSAGSREFVTSE